MNGPRQAQHAESGVAVITAILIMAMAASVASFLAWQQGLWFRQVENMREQAQAVALAEAGVEWARGILAEDARQGGADHLGELWAQPLLGLEVENGRLSGGIVDAQARFNLNNLRGTGAEADQYLAVFQRLLGLLQLSPDLAERIRAWVNAGQVPQTPGAPPAGRLLFTANSLYAVEGLERASVDKLFPFVTALPAPAATQINVNTASPELLAAYLNTSVSVAQGLVEQRKSEPFKALENFRARLPASLQGLDEKFFNVNSQYFMVTSQANVGRAQVRYRALLNRQGGGAAAWPKVLWRVQGES
ncbi:MAG: type II secretion system minor pseudopilin GspK [Pseudomonadota bacterium]